MNLLKGLAQRRNTTKGFTLVELLIVIAVIGILATVLIVAINPEKQLQKTRDTQRKAALKNIQNALEAYYVDNGRYPLSDCFSGNSGCWNLSGGSFLGSNATNYLKTIPVDPNDKTQEDVSCTTTDAYGYMYDTTSGTSYTLSTRLENTSDSQGQTGGVCTWGVTGVSVGSCDGSNPCTYSLINQQ